MGHDEVYVHANDAQTERGEAPLVLLEGAKPCSASVSVAELKTLLTDGKAQVIDFATSLQYREGHIPGAWHAIRSRLAAQLPKVPATSLLVFTAVEEALARLAATDAATLTATPVKVLTGGNAAWRASGGTIETGDDRMTGAAEDLSYRALDRKENVEQAMLDYLKWEVELLDAVATDPDFGFKRFA
jgi:3-mercaptopyruvate sulfurtransferase SseA